MEPKKIPIEICHQIYSYGTTEALAFQNLYENKSETKQ